MLLHAWAGGDVACVTISATMKIGQPTDTSLAKSGRITLVSATGVAISSCKLRTRPGADRGFARPSAGKQRTVLAAAAKNACETQVDAAAINEGASQNGCAAKLPSLGFALFHEVNRVQAKLYQTAAVTKPETGLTTSRPSGWGGLGDNCPGLQLTSNSTTEDGQSRFRSTRRSGDGSGAVSLGAPRVLDRRQRLIPSR